jgi:hypothetical protein
MGDRVHMGREGNMKWFAKGNQVRQSGPTAGKNRGNTKRRVMRNLCVLINVNQKSPVTCLDKYQFKRTQLMRCVMRERE